MLNVRSFALVMATVVTLGSPHAHAGGFLADTFLRPVSPALADLADGIHDKMGKPLDRAGAAAAKRFIPGLARNPRASAHAVGNFCGTHVGRFGPGPSNPVGTPCTARTPYGLARGHVVQ